MPNLVRNLAKAVDQISVGQFQKLCAVILFISFPMKVPLLKCNKCILAYINLCDIKYLYNLFNQEKKIL